MTLDVELHSSVISVGAGAPQTRWGFTVTSDKDTSVGAYLEGALQFGHASLTKGTRYHSYISYPVVGKYRLKWFTFAYGVSPPSAEPTDRQPELEFYVEAVGYSPRYFYLKDKDTKEDVYAFISFIRKDSPHLYNANISGEGTPWLLREGTVPASPADWMLVIHRRIDEKTMYYEMIDPTTIPEGFSDILMTKRSEAIGRCLVEVDFEGWKALYMRLLLYSDPLYWGLLVAGVISPEHAAWLLNHFFDFVFPSPVGVEIIAVHTRPEGPNWFDIDFRITPNGIKFWTQFAKELAKKIARVIPIIAVAIAVYFIIHEYRLIVTTPAQIVEWISKMTENVWKQSTSIQEKILADTTLTPEQKERALENVKTTTRNIQASALQTEKEVTVPIPWTTIITVIAIVLIVGFVIAIIR